MKTKQFTELKKEVKQGNIEGLKKEIIEDLTLKQAQTVEDLMLDIELNEEGNQILDIIVAYIESTVKEEKKVANKKAPAEEKKAPKKANKSQLKGNKETPEETNILDKIKVGSIIKFRVEDEEIKHNIKIVNIGKYNVIGIMKDDEKEVFNIRKSDLKKQTFAWTDRHNETYNIIVTIE